MATSDEPFDARKLFISIHERNLPLLQAGAEEAPSTSQSQRRVNKELLNMRTIEAAGADYVTCAPLPGTGGRQLLCSILGAVGTPYEGGVFHLMLLLPNTYPFHGPSARFMTKVYHPRVGADGSFYGDILAPENWCSALTMYTTLITIASVLSDQSAESVEQSLEPEIAYTMIEEPELFDRNARAHTEQYAREGLPSIDQARAIAESMIAEDPHRA